MQLFFCMLSGQYPIIASILKMDRNSTHVAADEKAIFNQGIVELQMCNLIFQQSSYVGCI